MSVEAPTAESPLTLPPTDEEAYFTFDGRIDLKTIFFCILAFAIPCRWVAVSAEQRWCVNELESMRAFSTYDFETSRAPWQDWQFESFVCRGRNFGRYDGHSLPSAICSPQPWEGFWLCDLGTRDMLHRVKSVNLTQHFSSPKLVQLIRRIGTVEHLYIRSATIDRSIVDVLQSVNSLQTLTLASRCTFTDTSLAELQERLPNCKVYYCPIGN